MSFFDKFTEMSWADPGIDDELHSHRFTEKPAMKVGLILFLAVVSSLFFLLVVAYSERMELSDWNPIAEPRVLWLNSLALVLASFAMQSARNRVAADRSPRGALVASGVLAFAFLGGQFLAWQSLAAQGYYSMANPAFAFFVLLTAVHALHLLGGLYVWARTVMRDLRGVEPGDLRPVIELSAIYWHYLLLVWVVLFVLLLTT